MNSSKFLSAVGLVLNLLIVGSAMAEPPEGMRGGEQPNANELIPDYDRRDPALARVSLQALNPVCPASGVVAFSVVGSAHISQGGATLLGYQSTITNAGYGWTTGGGTFIAPCSGLYVFTSSFVRYGNTGGDYTRDDVYIHIYHNGVSTGYAWSGQADISRSTGTYTVALLLQAGDYIQTYVTSDGGYKRYLNRYNLTGHLARPF